MNETKFVDSFNGQGELCHVESGDVDAKDFVLDEHCHKITAGKEFHEHVKEDGILEGIVKFHYPGTV